MHDITIGIAILLLENNLKKPTKSMHQFETILPKDLVKTWEQTLIGAARIRGLDKENATTQDKLEHILNSEHGNVKQLWEAFTTERERLPRYLLDPKKQTAAYLLGFHLPNAARMWNLLYRFGRDHKITTELMDQTPQIIDIGCGTGAMSQTLAFFLKKQLKCQPEVFLSDKQPLFLDTTAQGLRHLLGSEAEITAIKSEINTKLTGDLSRRVAADRPTFIILGYVWNELAQNPKARQALFDFLESRSSGTTMVFVLEPANQFIARDAMELRDAMVSARYSALYPCAHNLPCPMLKRSKDWCFSDTTWQTPGLIKKLNQRTKINQQRLKYAGYIFATESMQQSLQTQLIPKAYPVVGRPSVKNEPNRFEYLVCEGEQLQKYPATGLGDRILHRGEKLHTAKASSLAKPRSSSSSKKR